MTTAKAPSSAKDVLKLIKDNEVKYVDLRFTDPRGKWQHVTFDISMIDEEIFAEGTMFDGSSIAGWKAINESDMCLMPDPATAVIDPFFAETTLVLTCDVLEPTTGEPYNRDPRGIAKKAEGLVKAWGIGDTVFFGPEAEFFVFDDVKISAEPYKTGFKLDHLQPNAELIKSWDLPGPGWATVIPLQEPGVLLLGNFFTGAVAKFDMQTGAITAKAETGVKRSLAGLAQYPG